MNREELNGARVLVYFWAPWCGPCKVVKPLVERFGEENSEVEVVFCNIDEDQELAQEFGVRGIPTLVYLENGEEVGRKIGNSNYEQIKGLTEGTK